MELMVTALGTPPITARPLEVVERKGLGHPDTVCDALAEALSIGLSRFYRDRFGTILHHNVDKALLYGGAAMPAFGGGTVQEPMELYFSGRATREFRGVAIPVDDIATEVARSWFRTNFHALDADRHLRVRCLIRPGSHDLVQLFARQMETGVPLANDTSCGVGFAPTSDLERVVLAVEKTLNSPATREAQPEIGEDIKIMGVRRKDDIALTVACAVIDRYVADMAAYLNAKKAAAEIAVGAVRQAASTDIAVDVNTGDDPDRNDVYLTVTGTSAEAGDDGQVGRGNRANGLITPFRPMTMEAAAGKNAVTHVGKLYNIAAGRISADIVANVAQIEEAHCCMVSQIGRRVDDPQVAAIEVRTAGGVPVSTVKPAVEEIVHDHLGGLSRLWEIVIDGAIPVY